MEYKTTKINDIIPVDWKIINTITWNELKQKYNMNFNVLVVDCEGALYYTLKDEPEFSNVFETIMILQISHIKNL